MLIKLKKGIFLFLLVLEPSSKINFPDFSVTKIFTRI